MTTTRQRPRRRRGRRPAGVWPRALLWLGALGGIGFGGFLALERLDVAAAPMAASLTQLKPDPGTPSPGGAPVTPPKADKVKITFTTQPVVKTDLRWGKKKLGIINPTKNPGKKPFFIERPKDSGPMDVAAHAEGFLTLNTRVYTFADNKVLLKLTPESEKHTVLGYKLEIPPDGGVDGGVADGGVPGGAPAAGVVGPALPPGMSPPVPAPAPLPAKP